MQAFLCHAGGPWIIILFYAHLAVHPTTVHLVIMSMHVTCKLAIMCHTYVPSYAGMHSFVS